MLYQYPFNVPAYYALILRSLTVLEGLALITDPNFKVLGRAYPYMAGRLLQDPAPQLRDALIDLLFKDGSFRWARLENLLREGRKSSDYQSSAVLASFAGIVLAEDPGAARLRALVEAEAAKVVEALLLGGSAAGTAPLVALLPAPLRQLAPWQLGLVDPEEEARLTELRAQVLRVWALAAPPAVTDGGAGAAVQSLLAVLQEPRAARFGQSVTNRVVERITARAVKRLLGVPSTGQGAAPGSWGMGEQQRSWRGGRQGGGEQGTAAAWASSTPPAATATAMSPPPGRGGVGDGEGDTLLSAATRATPARAAGDTGEVGGGRGLGDVTGSAAAAGGVVVGASSSS